MTLCTLCGSHSGRLTRSHTACLDTKRCESRLVRTYATPRNKQIRKALGNKCSIRDICRFFEKGETLFRSRCDMDIHRMCSTRYAVMILTGIHIFVARNGVQAFDAPRFSNTGMYCNRCHITVPELFKVFLEDSGNLEHRFPQAAFRSSKIPVIKSIARCTGHIDRHLSRTERRTKPRSPELGNAERIFHGKKFFADWNAMAVLSLLIMMHGIDEQWRIRIHASQNKIGRKRLHGRIFIRLHRNARHGCKVPVSCTIDIHVAVNSLGPVLVFKEDLGYLTVPDLTSA